MDLRLLYYKFKQKYIPSMIKKGEFKYILENSGIKIGKGTMFYDSRHINIDRTRPYLLEIGEYCKITSGVTILTHDYSRSVLRRTYGEILGEGRKTKIGNNVFIGMNAIILMGAHIGDNVIIGAGSVVSGCIPNNVVVAGNPGKVICTLDEFYHKRKSQVLDSAVECVNAFFDAHGRYPNVKEIGAFWPLFMERDEQAVLDSGVFVHLNGDCYEDIMRDFLKTEATFTSYDEFINYCKVKRSE